MNKSFRSKKHGVPDDKQFLTGSKNIGHSEAFRFAYVIDVAFGRARGQAGRKTGMKAGLFQDAWE